MHLPRRFLEGIVIIDSENRIKWINLRTLETPGIPPVNLTKQIPKSFEKAVAVKR